MKQRRFTNKKLIALMLPLAVDQLLNSFMGTVDTLVVSNLGSAAISAVSLVDSINILVVQAFFALVSGGTVVCSHYLGCEKRESNECSQAVSVYYIRNVTGHCNRVSFIQQPASWSDLWTGGTSGYGQCEEVLLLFGHVLSIYRIVR